MRSVYPNAEIPHLWAHRRQEFARNGKQSFWFDKGILYSYREPIGRIVMAGHPLAIARGRLDPGAGCGSAQDDAPDNRARRPGVPVEDRDRANPHSRNESDENGSHAHLRPSEDRNRRGLA